MIDIVEPNSSRTYRTELQKRVMSAVLFSSPAPKKAMRVSTRTTCGSTGLSACTTSRARPCSECDSASTRSPRRMLAPGVQSDLKTARTFASEKRNSQRFAYLESLPHPGTVRRVHREIAHREGLSFLRWAVRYDDSARWPDLFNVVRYLRLDHEVI